MKFIYVGQHENSPKNVTAFGYTFEKQGTPVDVREDSIISKLSSNRSFREVRKGSASRDKKQPEIEHLPSFE